MFLGDYLTRRKVIVLAKYQYTRRSHGLAVLCGDQKSYTCCILQCPFVAIEHFWDSLIKQHILCTKLVPLSAIYDTNNSRCPYRRVSISAPEKYLSFLSQNPLKVCQPRMNAVRLWISTSMSFTVLKAQIQPLVFTCSYRIQIDSRFDTNHNSRYVQPQNCLRIIVYLIGSADEILHTW